MKLAVTYEDGKVFQHFGHCSQFKLFEIEENKVISSEIVSAEGYGHESLVDFLVSKGVSTLICGGIGGGAKAALEKGNIKLFGGTSGDADKQVESFLKNELNYNPDVTCSHHDEKEHGEHEHHGTCGHNCH